MKLISPHTSTSSEPTTRNTLHPMSSQDGKEKERKAERESFEDIPKSVTPGIPASVSTLSLTKDQLYPNPPPPMKINGYVSKEELPP